MRIAFTGVFDLKNYGDHLFYVLFEKELESRGVSYTMDLYSTYEYEHQFYGDRHIYALQDLEERHVKEPYDAFIVGGGGIINLLYSEQKLDLSKEEFIKYSFGDLWVIPALVAEKYGVKCVWNAPEVPNSFSAGCHDFVKKVCSSLEYISVRDERSKEYLAECGVDEGRVWVVPDTALIVHRYFSADALKKAVSGRLGLDRPYIVFHANRWIPEESFEELDRVFRYAKEQGYDTVFLPLAYTHADDEILRHVQKHITADVHMFDKELDVYEMLAVLGSAELYIGVSFHGAVTAMQYGKKALAYDYMNNKKMENLFSIFQHEEYYLTEAGKLYDKAVEILGRPIDYSCALRKAVGEIEQHFNRMFAVLENPDFEKKKINNLITTVSRGFDDNSFEIMTKQRELQQKSDEIDNLQKELRRYGAAVCEGQQGIEKMNEVLQYYKDSAEGFEKNLLETQELLKYYKESSEGFERNLHQTQEALQQLTQELETIKATKIYKVMRRMNKQLQ